MRLNKMPMNVQSWKKKIKYEIKLRFLKCSS